MFKRQSKFKKGATSVYVVVIATLLFSVVTVSFIRIIINEASKTTSDELAQSAYDSALAGVEDAKTALKQYYECVDADSTEGTCERVVKALNERGFNASTTGYCDAVSEALGRISVGADQEVLVKEVYDSTNSANDENIVQAYTCVIVDNTPSDYRSTLGSGDTIRVIPLKTENPNSVTGIRILWYAEDDEQNRNYLYDSSSNKFTPLGNGNSTPVPPTLSAQIIQTAKTFTLGQFENSQGSSTNRGTVFLVPSKQTSAINHIGQQTVIDSNNHDYSGRASATNPNNQPQLIKCENSALSEVFACVASIELPSPIANEGTSERNGDTFFLVLSLPYGQPTTAFAVQLCTDDLEPGGGNGSARGDCRKTNGEESIADFKDVQIAVDSTGRANDMYSRVEARVEFRDIYFPFPEFAIQATSQDNDAIKKNFYVTDNCISTPGNGSANPCGSDTGEGN